MELSRAVAFEADAITTEVIRHGLASAAGQMKRALVRTALSSDPADVRDDLHEEHARSHYLQAFAG